MHGKGQRTLSKLDSEVTKVPSVRFLGSIDFFGAECLLKLFHQDQNSKRLSKAIHFFLEFLN